MSHLFARIKQRGEREKYRVVLQTDQQLYASVDSMIEGEVPYNQETVLDDKEWFFICGFRQSAFAIDILGKDINSVDYNTLSEEEFNHVDYLLATSQDNDALFFQKIGVSSLVKKKTVWLLGGRYEFEDQSTFFEIKDLPDAIYVRSKDSLYFRKLSSIASIFPRISNIYREATKEETDAFLSMEFITAQGLSVDRVGTTNRKRIAMAMDVLERLGPEQKNEIFSYVAQYCPEISDGDYHFSISNNKELSLLLFGIEQRFYTTPIGGEKRIANSVIRL